MTLLTLRLGLAGLGLALAVPAALLSLQALRQIEWEVFHQLQQQSIALTRRMDERVIELTARESVRPASQWRYWAGADGRAGTDGTPSATPSPLAALPEQLDFPGLLGYFEIDALGRVCTPLLPCGNEQTTTLPADERQQRERLVSEIHRILREQVLSGEQDSGGALAGATLGGVTLGGAALARAEFADALQEPAHEASDAKTETAASAPAAASAKALAPNSAPAPASTSASVPASASAPVSASALAPTKDSASASATAATPAKEDQLAIALDRQRNKAEAASKVKVKAAETQGLALDTLPLARGQFQRSLEEARSQREQSFPAQAPAILAQAPAVREAAKAEEAVKGLARPNVTQPGLIRPDQVSPGQVPPSALSSGQPYSRPTELDLMQPDLPRPDPTTPGGAGPGGAAPETAINLFDHLDAPMQLALLGGGRLLLHRRVGEDRATVQGLVIDANAFFDQTLGALWAEDSPEQPGRLLIAWGERILASYAKGTTSAGSDLYRGTSLADATYRAPSTASDFYRQKSPASAKTLRDTDASLQQLRASTGTLLYQHRLPPPLQDLQVALTVDSLPAGAGKQVVWLSSAVLTLILLGGFWLIERTARRQFDLLARQQNFVAAVSHELKTPLTAIRMYAEMLQQGWASPDKARSHAGIILSESERLSRLINQVLLLARVSRRPDALHLHTLEIGPLFETLRPSLEALAKAQSFNLHCAVDANAAGSSIAVDPDALQQILINLLDNAIKFSRPAGATEVHLRVTDAQGAIAWSVRDFGPGIPKNQMRKVFEPFYRGENELTRRTSGTGIGLTLVAQLAKAMRATIRIENANPGTEVVLSFAVGPDKRP